jgi:hypothetical protein
MSEMTHIEYVVRGLVDGFRLADEESKPNVSVKFVPLAELAELIGYELLNHLADIKWEDEIVPIFTARSDGMELSVAMTNLERDVSLMKEGALPDPKRLARYSAGLVEFIVLAGQSALVKFRQEIDGEALRKAVEFGAWLFPHAVSNVGGMWCVLTWFKDPPSRRF